MIGTSSQYGVQWGLEMTTSSCCELPSEAISKPTLSSEYRDRCKGLNQYSTAFYFIGGISMAFGFMGLVGIVTNSLDSPLGNFNSIVGTMILLGGGAALRSMSLLIPLLIDIEQHLRHLRRTNDAAS